MDPVVSQFAELIAQGKKLFRDDIKSNPLGWTKENIVNSRIPTVFQAAAYRYPVFQVAAAQPGAAGAGATATRNRFRIYLVI
ncbi:hypothetical protein NQ318_023358 [Aromia moschata]|uniref:Uncharacterized protein n=1 Tax=Aromia moschata TaxID=1265417 RepID=A0AAV8XCQ8_9CUCU|nr:hypothetical protein NQ318_023358 [Aromia moschata]